MDWIPVNPKKYDGPHEVGIPSDPPTVISPYDVPDGVRVRADGEKFLIELRYGMTPLEPPVFTHPEGKEFTIKMGQNSNRVIGMRLSVLPPDGSEIISNVIQAAYEHATDRVRANNYRVATTVLMDHWGDLIARAASLESGIAVHGESDDTNAEPSSPFWRLLDRWIRRLGARVPEGTAPPK